MASITYTGNFGAKAWNTGGGISSFCSAGSAPSGTKTISSINVSINTTWKAYGSSSVSGTLSLGSLGTISIGSQTPNATPFYVTGYSYSSTSATLPSNFTATLSGVLNKGQSGTECYANAISITVTYEDYNPPVYNYTVTPPSNQQIFIGASSNPTEVFYGSATASSFYLKWSASSTGTGGIGYYIYRDGSYFASTTSTSYQVSTSGLLKGNTYVYTIRAYNTSSTGYYIDYNYSAFFEYQEDTVGSPSNIKVNSSSFNLIVLSGANLTITWNSASNATGYRYSYKINGVENTGTTSSTSYSFTFSGVAGNTVTEVKVQAYNANGNSSYVSWGYTVKINTPPVFPTSPVFSTVSYGGTTVVPNNNVYIIKAASATTLSITLPSGTDIDGQSLTYYWTLYKTGTTASILTGSGLTATYTGTFSAGEEYYITMRIYDGLEYTPSTGYTTLTSKITVGVEISGVTATATCDTSISTVFYQTVNIAATSSGGIKPSSFNFYYSVNGGTTFTLMEAITPVGATYTYSVPASIINIIPNGKIVQWKIEAVGMNTKNIILTGYNKVRWPSISSYIVRPSSIPADPNYGVLGASGSALVPGIETIGPSAYKDIISSLILKWDADILAEDIVKTTDFGASSFKVSYYITYGPTDYLSKSASVVPYGTTTYASVANSIYYLDWISGTNSSRFNNQLISNISLRATLSVQWGTTSQLYEITSTTSKFDLNFECAPAFLSQEFSAKDSSILNFIEPTNILTINYPRGIDTNRTLSGDKTVTFNFFLQTEQGSIITLGSDTKNYATNTETTHSSIFTVPFFSSLLKKQKAELFITIVDDNNAAINKNSPAIDIINNAFIPLKISVLGYIGDPVLDSISYSRDSDFVEFKFRIADIGGNTTLADSSSDFNTYNNIRNGILYVNYSKDNIFDDPDTQIRKNINYNSWSSGFTEVGIFEEDIESEIDTNGGMGKYVLRIYVDDVEFKKDDSLYINIAFSNGTKTTRLRTFYVEGTDPVWCLHTDGLSIRTFRKDENVSLSIRDQGTHIIDFYSSDNTNNILGFLSAGQDNGIQLTGLTIKEKIMLNSIDWEDSNGTEYSATYSLSHPTITDTSLQSIYPSYDISHVALQDYENGQIIMGQQNGGTHTLTLLCFGTKPTINIPITLTVQRM